MEKRNKIFLFGLVWKCAKSRIIWMFIICILTIIPQFVSIYGLKIVVDLIVVQTDTIKILISIGFLVALEIIFSIFNSIYNNSVVPYSNVKIKKHLNDQLFIKLSQMDIQCYQNKEFYDIYTLGAKDADKIVTEYIENLNILISGIVKLVFIIAIVAVIDCWVLFVPILAIISSLIFNFCIGRLMYKYSNIKTKKERYYDYIKRIFYSQAYAKEMIVLPMKRLIFKEYDDVNNEIKNITKQYSKKVCLLEIISNIIFNIFGFGLILFIISFRVLHAGYGIGNFIALANASLAIISSFMYVVSVVPELSKYKLFSKNITNLLEYKNEINSPISPILHCEEDYAIEFKNVSFAYPFNSELMVLKNINLRIEKNKKVAIVGFNGSGKTTLLNLLLRLYDPVVGKITLADRDLKDYDIAFLRNQFNILFQDFQQYPVSIAEFILMRSPEDEKDISLIWESLARVGLMDKIKSLPSNISTKITKEFDDNGVLFSGGELQKLMLARVFSQPQNVLVLDEPSSALDALSENYIFDEIIKNIHDKTVIFVTHRLSAAKDADIIILLKNGEIVQQGAHNDLMNQQGEYRTMYEMQAKKFELDPDEKIKD